jgi:ribosomal protein L40E
MKCPRCQHENPGDAVFCEQCGSRVERACRGCGTANRLDGKFCKKCGRPVTVPAPASYTPRHLAEKILTSKTALEGERKLVTVLFADLKGSMARRARPPRRRRARTGAGPRARGGGRSQAPDRGRSPACRGQGSDGHRPCPSPRSPARGGRERRVRARPAFDDEALGAWLRTERILPGQ